MEKQPDDTSRVQITKTVFEGFELIRRSGATNMLDRPMVLHLAREWDFTEPADWIESVDTGTYARLIFQGPDVVEDDRADQPIYTGFGDQDLELAPTDDVDEHEVTEMAMDRVRETMQDLLAALGKHAILTIADTYETQSMGVLVSPSRNDLIARERDALIRSLGEASSLWQQLDQAMIGVERGIGSLQYLIDPENN